MKVNIIIIGDEILLGRVTDTNSGAIARALDPLGFTVGRIVTIGDSAGQIRKHVESSLADAELTITTGGLGPTKDDITKHTLCSIFGGRLVRDPEVTENIHRIFAAKSLKLNPLTEDQALVPDCCRVIQNLLGTAPIMWFERDGHVLISMPGVPFETEGMLERAVRNEIARRFCRDMTIAHRTCVVTGISESSLAQKLEAFEDALPAGAHLAYLPDSPLITLRLDVTGNNADDVETLADSVFGTLKNELGELMLCDHAASPAEIVLERLRKRGLTLSTAESCTGGNIAHCITMIAGCSDVFAGGIVSYANEVKENVLGVPRDVLEANGAVSEPVVRAMAAGAMRATGTSAAVATSGIAGPSGAVEGKPVGTVWTAVVTPRGTFSELYYLAGPRSEIIDKATLLVLRLLLNHL